MLSLIYALTLASSINSSDLFLLAEVPLKNPGLGRSLGSVSIFVDPATPIFQESRLDLDSKSRSAFQIRYHSGVTDLHGRSLSLVSYRVLDFDAKFPAIELTLELPDDRRIVLTLEWSRMTQKPQAISRARFEHQKYNALPKDLVSLPYAPPRLGQLASNSQWPADCMSGLQNLPMGWDHLGE